MTDKEVIKILIEWVRLALSNPEFVVIEANQNGYEPKGSYASLLPYNGSSVGLGASRYSLQKADENTFDHATSSIRDVPVSLNFYRDNAHEYARQIMHFVNTNTSKEYFGKKKYISLFVPDSYRRLDELEDSGLIERAQIELRLHCASDYVETVNAIDEVVVNINDSDEIITVNEQ